MRKIFYVYIRLCAFRGRGGEGERKT